MKFFVAAVILFFANVLFASDCTNKALQAAQKVDGSVSSTVAGGSRKVEKGSLDSYGKPVSEFQANMANGRADAIKAATGRELTPQQATALLNDASAKELLGADYKYYLAEKVKIGGAAVLKAEEEAVAKALAAAEAQKKIDAAAEQKRQVAAAEAAEARRRADPNYNPYLETDATFKPPPTTVIGKQASELEKSTARSTLAAQVRGSEWAGKIDRAAYEQSSVYFGVKATMDNYATKIRQLNEAINSNGLDVSVKSSYKIQLNNLKKECGNLAAIVEKAGLVGAINVEVDRFISTTCR